MDSATFGQVAIPSGAAFQLTSIATTNSDAICLKAHDANAGKLYLGVDNTVSSTTGFELSAGKAITLSVQNARKLWAIGTSADRISWAAVSA